MIIDIGINDKYNNCLLLCLSIKMNCVTVHERNIDLFVFDLMQIISFKLNMIALV